MERKMAEQVIGKLNNQNGPKLTLLEAMSMTKVMTDWYEIYAIQKADVTFLAWKREDGSVVVKIQCW